MRNNESFKQANESIRGQADAIGSEMEPLPFLCECPAEDCVQIVMLTRAQYGAIREHPDHYMTTAGHEDRERPIGTVVSRNDGYVIIEKSGNDES